MKTLLLRITDLSTLAGLCPRKLREVAGLGGAALWPGGRRFYLRPVAEHILHGCPLSNPFGAEPRLPMLHRAQVREWLGLTDSQLDHLLTHTDEAKLCFRATANSQRLFRTHRLRELLTPLCPATLLSSSSS